ncbi:hypothetical protein RF11_05679 [Thelohanellus kitauei]|uniref:Uncharacterized protein n=1 Tax=Thelohanellus kitauei TaxID=669202 RepID=A0A0C2MVE8_THEKT|nr:hypothetical protein RF11_05679 [Thelohanellus kitauei]
MATICFVLLSPNQVIAEKESAYQIRKIKIVNYIMTIYTILTTISVYARPFVKEPHLVREPCVADPRTKASLTRENVIILWFKPWDKFWVKENVISIIEEESCQISFIDL